MRHVTCRFAKSKTRTPHNPHLTGKKMLMVILWLFPMKQNPTNTWDHLYLCVKFPWRLDFSVQLMTLQEESWRPSVVQSLLFLFLFQTLTGPIGTCFHSSTYGKQNWVIVQARPIRRSWNLGFSGLTWCGSKSRMLFFPPKFLFKF